MKNITTIMLGPSGHLAVFDEDQNQVGELQGGVLQLLGVAAEAKGYNIEGAVFETSRGISQVIKTPEGGWVSR